MVLYPTMLVFTAMSPLSFTPYHHLDIFVTVEETILDPLIILDTYPSCIQQLAGRVVR